MTEERKATVSPNAIALVAGGASGLFAVKPPIASRGRPLVNPSAAIRVRENFGRR